MAFQVARSPVSVWLKPNPSCILGRIVV